MRWRPHSSALKFMADVTSEIRRESPGSWQKCSNPSQSVARGLLLSYEIRWLYEQYSSSTRYDSVQRNKPRPAAVQVDLSEIYCLMVSSANDSLVIEHLRGSNRHTIAKYLDLLRALSGDVSLR